MMNYPIFQIPVRFLCFPMDLQCAVIKDLIVWHQVAWELSYINILLHDNFLSLKYFSMFEYKTFPSVLKYFITGQLARDRDDTTLSFLIILSRTIHPSFPQTENERRERLQTNITWTAPFPCQSGDPEGTGIRSNNSICAGAGTLLLQGIVWTLIQEFRTGSCHPLVSNHSPKWSSLLAN